MASITQTISNYTAGISQQAEELMLPGQVTELVNGLPDITDGLVKRSGTKFLSKLSGATTDGSWFSYYRDESEGVYIGQVSTDGIVRLWQIDSNGNVTNTSVTNNATTYFTHQPGDLKFTTANDYTFVTNTSSLVSMRSVFSAPRNRPYEYFLTLKQLSHGRSYNFEISTGSAPKIRETVATALKVQAVQNFTSTDQSSDSSYTRVSLQIDDDTFEDRYYQLGFENDNPDGRFTASETFVVPTETFETLSTKGYDGRNLAFRLTTTAQVNLKSTASNVNSGSDYQSIYNTTVELLYGGHGWKKGDFVFVDMSGTSNSQNQKYKVTVTEVAERKVHQEARFRPAPTSFEATTPIDAESILSQITDDYNQNYGNSFIRTSTNPITLVTEVIGNGIYIGSYEEFNVTTSEPDLWSILSRKAVTSSELPSQCKHGFIVEVTNSGRSDEDSYYLKFVGDNDKDGLGAWEETIEPGLSTTIDAATLPHTIVRNDDGSFTADVFKINNDVAWKPRQVGDEDTNPLPSFIDNNINQTIFHRNRLGFLSKGNVILSQAGDLGNFFFDSALVVSPDDPIDIAASSTVPVKFTSAIETATGLIGFAESQQFLLHTDSDTLTPETCKISNISTYRYNPLATPVSLGTTIGFTDKAGNNTRFFEMFDISKDREPQIIDQTKIVQSLLPSSIDHVVNSRENNTVFFLERATNSIFGYRYHNVNNQRIQSAWFQWTFPFSIEYMFCLDDKLFLVQGTSTGYYLYECYIKPYGTETTISGTGIYGNTVDYVSFLDAFYTTDFNTTSSTTHTWQPDSVYPDLYQYEGYENIVAIVDGQIYKPSSISGNIMTFSTSIGGNITFGIPFLFKVSLPQIYISKTVGSQQVPDLTASLTIQRMQLRFGNIGQFSVNIKRIGKDDFSKEYNQTVLNDYRVNDSPVDKVLTIAVPVYERNTNFNTSVTSTHPGPVNFRSMTWEGAYTPMYHKRV